MRAERWEGGEGERNTRRTVRVSEGPFRKKITTGGREGRSKGGKEEGTEGERDDELHYMIDNLRWLHHQQGLQTQRELG